MQPDACICVCTYPRLDPVVDPVVLDVCVPCVMCAQDLTATKDAIERYKDMLPQLDGSRECKLIEVRTNVHASCHVTPCGYVMGASVMLQRDDVNEIHVMLMHPPPELCTSLRR